MAQNFYGSICLSDIPKDLITHGKNGKKYLSIVVNERREVGKYGHTHYIKVYAKKKSVSPDATLYIGELKPSEFEDSPKPETTAITPSASQPLQFEDTDLPF